MTAEIAVKADVHKSRGDAVALDTRGGWHREDVVGLLRDLKSLSDSISYDLRVPLRAIDGYSQILEEDFADDLGDEGRRIIRVIRNGSQTMDRLVAGLAEFLRAASTTTPLGLDTVDMKALAAAAAKEVASLHRGLEPRIEIADLPSVEGDATVLRKVWCNLIANALKYSAKRPQPQVSISGRIDDREAIYRIQDNGAGFDPRYSDRLFGVFQCLHKPEEFAGTGVGLAIVQRILARHGGRVWAEGAPDAGACFQFALPIAD